MTRGLDRLNDVQIAVLSGTLAGESYPMLADRSTYTVEYLREVGAKLWQILTQALGEPVNKKNIRSVLQRYQQSVAVTALERQYFWGESIDVSLFYGRTQELKTLDKWINQDRCRLIEILAIGGMGKTALAVKLAQKTKEQFEFVVWRSLRNAPLLTDLLAETIALISQQQEIELAVAPDLHISRLLHYLREHRCLLILDNVESILLSGSPRNYLAGYEGYGELFRRVAESTHQSCVLLTSREQMAEVANFAGDRLPVRVLPLGGLSIAAGMAILDDKGLPLTIEHGQELVDLYAGNPLALKIVSTSILELFDGKVTEFLGQGAAVFNGIRLLLERQFERLSVVEQQIMYWLAIGREWVTVNELQADLFPAVAMGQLLESLEYLQGRSLIERKEGRFTQQPVVMEYAIEQLLGVVRQEICSGAPQLFLRYAVMKAQAKDYVRESQIRTIVRPLLAMLESDLGGRESIILAVKQILLGLRADGLAMASYGAGNCLNLLNQLGADLTGLDLTGLSIRQADLRDVPLHHVNLTHTNLATSLFAESIGDVYKVAISPDDRLVAKGGSDGKITIWQIDNRQSLLKIKAHDSHVVGLVFTADSKKLFSSSFDRTIKIWDLDSGNCLHTWQLNAPVYRIALSPDDLILASGSNCGDVLLWDVTTKELLNKFTGHTMTVLDISFQPQGKLLASSSFDTSIKIWDLNTGNCLRTLTEHTQVVSSVNFNSLGTQVASSGLDTLIKIWDVESGQCLQTIQQHTRTVIDVLFSPNSQQLISGSQDLSVRIWDEVQPNEWNCSIVLQGHENTIWSIALSATGKILVSSDQSGVLKLWDAKSGQCLKTFSSITKAFRSLAFHPNGHLIAGASHHPDIKIWNVETGKCDRSLQGHTSENWTVAFHPQGDLLASGGEDSSVRLWNIHSGECCYVLSEHTAAICCVAFSPDGNYLASASKDYTIRIWEVATGRCIRTLNNHTDLVNFLVFHPDEQRLLLASCSHDETIRLWDTDFWICIKTLRPQRVYENMNITGATGLTPAQLATLKTLGAITKERS